MTAPLSRSDRERIREQIASWYIPERPPTGVQRTVRDDMLALLDSLDSAERRAEEAERLWARRIDESREKNTHIAQLEEALRTAPADFIPPTYIEGTYFCRYCFALETKGGYEVLIEGHGHMVGCWLVRARSLLRSASKAPEPAEQHRRIEESAKALRDSLSPEETEDFLTAIEGGASKAEEGKSG